MFSLHFKGYLSKDLKSTWRQFQWTIEVFGDEGYEQNA